MLKKIFAAAILSAAFALPAAAQKMNCESELTKAQAALEKMSGLSAAQKAARGRIAQQAYDLCVIGEADTAKKYFRMMQESSS